MTENLRNNLADVQQKIEIAAERAGRNPAEIKLIAVSKTHPVEIVRAAVEAGMIIFGENKVQEAEAKISALECKDCEWHLIGHLQSNKVRKAVKNFDVIQTLDSVALAERLERICGEENVESLKVLIQIDLAGEENKEGIEKKDLSAMLKFLADCRHLKLDGLMTVPPFLEDVKKVRPFFRQLREIRDEFLPEGALSMGMSHDFETAISEGATIIRVGTALFGKRNYQK